MSHVVISERQGRGRRKEKCTLKFVPAYYYHMVSSTLQLSLNITL